MSNPVDNLISYTKETVAGVTPANPVFKYLDVKRGANLTFNMQELSSETMRQNRDASGIRKVAGQSSGTLTFELSETTAITDLLRAAYSAAPAVDGVYKGGNTDTSFTFEQRMTSETGEYLYIRYRNVHVSKATISVDATGKATISVDLQGGEMDTDTAILTGATYVNVAPSTELVGLDVGLIAIAGVTARYLSLELSIEQPRTPAFCLGQRDAFSVGTDSNRVVKLVAKIFRKDLSPETLFIPDTPREVSFDIKDAAGKGYIFENMAMVGSAPANEEDSGKNIVTVTLTAQYDATAGFASSFTALSEAD